MLHNKSNLKQICDCEIFINFLYITSNKLFVILYNKKYNKLAGTNCDCYKNISFILQL